MEKKITYKSLTFRAIKDEEESHGAQRLTSSTEPSCEEICLRTQWRRGGNHCDRVSSVTSLKPESV